MALAGLVSLMGQSGFGGVSEFVGLGCVAKTRRVPEEAVLRTEYLFRTGKACFCAQSASENASRTVGGRFRYRISLPYRRSLFFTPNASENASRTPEGGFRAPNILSVPEKPVFYTECF